MTRRFTGPDARTRALVYARDSYTCQLCGSADGPLVIHHRRPRGLGGSRRDDTNLPSNLVVLDERCHESIESKRDVARSFGFLVRQGQDPSSAPIRLPVGWFYLHADGTVQAAREAS